MDSTMGSRDWSLNPVMVIRPKVERDWSRGSVKELVEFFLNHRQVRLVRLLFQIAKVVRDSVLTQCNRSVWVGRLPFERRASPAHHMPGQISGCPNCPFSHRTRT